MVVLNSDGSIDNNDGSIDYKYNDGSIDNNDGSIDNNDGSIDNNDGSKWRCTLHLLCITIRSKLQISLFISFSGFWFQVLL